jgi:hypothetical protein
MLKVKEVSEEHVASNSRVVEGESRNQREAGRKLCFTALYTRRWKISYSE